MYVCVRTTYIRASVPHDQSMHASQENTAAAMQACLPTCWHVCMLLGMQAYSHACRPACAQPRLRDGMPAFQHACVCALCSVSQSKHTYQLRALHVVHACVRWLAPYWAGGCKIHPHLAAACLQHVCTNVKARGVSTGDARHHALEARKLLTSSRRCTQSCHHRGAGGPTRAV